MNTGDVLTAGNAAGLGYRELDLANALARQTPAVQQNFMWSTGCGPIEDACGGSHVVRDSVSLTGESSVWGPLSTSTWASRSAAQSSRSGGQWMGHQLSAAG
ncbi:hypothetical protein OHA72_27190 [Dactylosporangium sp. NBC_01737]|uniref:hypothetical protein n=1 Tax=Dactylosporangium sp. NBC_01737 TaxID=2975959 RepID=UPI002E1156F5|nr:hypothetical protein OHA72_27190 [Dactylosporangium sp. NBC_01737]